MQSRQGPEQIPLLVAVKFIEFISVYFPSFLDRNILNISENGPMAAVPLAFDTRLKKMCANFHRASCPIRLHW